MEIPRPKAWAYSKSSTGYPASAFLDLFLASVYYTCNSTSLLLQVFTTTLQQSQGGGGRSWGQVVKVRNLGSNPNFYTKFMTWGKRLKFPSLSFPLVHEHPPGSLGCVSTRWLTWHRTHSNGCSIHFNFLFSTWPRGRSEVGRKGTEIHLRMTIVHNSIF